MWIEDISVLAFGSSKNVGTAGRKTEADDFGACSHLAPSILALMNQPKAFK